MGRRSLTITRSSTVDDGFDDDKGGELKVLCTKVALSVSRDLAGT